MKRIFVTAAVAAALCIPAAYGHAKGKGESGKALFNKNCASCHANGGNVVNPKFGLHKKDREAHGVKTAKDIIGKMRNPGPGMPKFDKSAIPDRDAKKIADYIIKTFK